jgi:hypothetical protein
MHPPRRNLMTDQKSEFQQSVRLPVPARDAFDWHARPGAFERLNPPWAPARLVLRSGGIEDGARIEFIVRLGPLRQRWVAEHRGFVDGRQFQDVQVRGPFAEWEHTHTILPEGDSGWVRRRRAIQGDSACELRDEIRYRLPAGALGRLLAGGMIERQLRRVFRYRHRVTAADLSVHARYSEGRAMKILVSGSSGLVGSQLCPFLATGGHEVVPLTRPKSNAAADAVHWDPAGGTIDRDKLDGFDAVVHLAGENIGDRRWSAEQKAKIRNSRVDGTRLLCTALASLDRPPKTVVCASAIGFYGDRGDELLDESSSPGEGFLPDVCRDWEAACEPAREKGIRVVNTRFGVVLSPQGGALAKMLFPFKMCAGGAIGGGKQYWSWVALDDVISAILHALATESVKGPVNVVSPHPVTNRDFTKTLGRVLGRPTILPMPAFLARLALGEMADDLLLASARVQPKRLQETGYEFRFCELEPALRHLLGK